MKLMSIKAIHPRLICKKNVRDWYMDKYSDDELAQEINPKITFNDIREIIDAKKDIYDFLNVADSLIRQRIFAELANLLGVRYEVVYEAWLD
jgi:hypothetical protein